MSALAGAIDSLQTHGELPIRRRGTVAYSNGYAATPSDTSGTIRGVVQPAMSDDLQLLPEGRRTEQAYAVWTKDEIQGADRSTGAAGDIITIDGKDYEVAHVESWPGSGNYKRVVATRVTP